jgi:hypothetical protein
VKADASLLHRVESSLFVVYQIISPKGAAVPVRARHCQEVLEWLDFPKSTEWRRLVPTRVNFQPEFSDAAIARFAQDRFRLTLFRFVHDRF